MVDVLSKSGDQIWLLSEALVLTTVLSGSTWRVTGRVHISNPILSPYLITIGWLICSGKHRKAFHPLRHLMVWSSLLPDVSVSEIFSMVDRLPKEAASSVEPAGAKPVKRHSSIQKQRKEWLNLLQDNNGAGIKSYQG